MVEADGPTAHVQPVDQEQFLLLVQPLLRPALRLAHAMLRNPSEAEDVVQESTLRAWSRIRSFRPGTDFPAWFLTIVANQCRQTLRSRWWHVLRDPSPSPVRQFVAPPQDGIAVAGDVRRALARVSYDHRIALVLRFYLDLPYEDIARILSISVPTARSRVHRALDKLRPHLADLEETSHD